MERSSSHEEERSASFYVYHPCYFLEEALRALFRCLGIESEGTTMCSQEEEEKEEDKNSLLKTPSGSDPTKNLNPPTSTLKASSDVQDPPSTNIVNSLARRVNAGRGSEVSDGSGPQHN
ncbi:hypothetical protein Fmac_023752 [Flemingia macrophylla]|uniref:Elicitor peptide n=1 Tax=Flemingia macrophylla TaxID=520843 RepID=A0ABD1LME7_9FABA